MKIVGSSFKCLAAASTSWAKTGMPGSKNQYVPGDVIKVLKRLKLSTGKVAYFTMCYGSPHAGPLLSLDLISYARLRGKKWKPE